MSYLTIIGKDGRTFRRDIDSDVVTIGRSGTNDVNLSFDQSLSRFHAEVTRREGRYFVADIGSRNGTNLNGRPITAATEITIGDRITLGGTTILFGVEQEPRVAIEEAPLVRVDSATLTMSLEEIIGSGGAAAISSPGMPGQAALGPRPSPESRTLAVLARAGMELISHRALEEVFEVIMDLVFEAILAERGFLMLIEGEGRELVSKVIRVLERRHRNTISLSRTIARMVVDDRQSVLTGDAQADDRFKMQDSVVLQRIRSAMCVPLWNNREVIGLIYADTINAAKTFTLEDLKLLTLLANVAAVKIENSRLFEETVAKRRMEKELQHASEIQRKLLPSVMPVLPGYEVTGYNDPCREVGGDYFDFIERDSGRLAFAIGDVSGKGMGAALLMATVRASFRAHIQMDGPLEKLVSALNATILQSADSGSFVTFFYGEIETATGRLRYVNAGHNPPILVRSGGHVERLPAGGLILGVIPGALYRMDETCLDPGDLLAAYSDWVTETQDEVDEEYGEQRLINLLKECRAEPVGKIQQAVCESLRVFAGAAPVYDDTTLLLIRRHAS